MAINNVSFGKIYKVNAPVYIAKQIIEKANIPNNKNLNWKTKLFFCDITHKQAYTYSFNKDKGSSYIFSGKDAKKYRDSYDIAYDTMTYVHDYYADEKSADLDTKLAWEAHEKRMKKLVDSHKRIPSIDIIYNPGSKQINKLNFSV